MGHRIHSHKPTVSVSSSRRRIPNAPGTRSASGSRPSRTATGVGVSTREGVEAEEITDDEFDVRDRMEAFVDAGGDLEACGTCLELRNSEGEYCPMSTMSDLLEVVTSSDRVLTIG